MATWSDDDDDDQNYRGLLGYFTVDTPQGPQLIASTQAPDTSTMVSAPQTSSPQTGQPGAINSSAFGPGYNGDTTATDFSKPPSNTSSSNMQSTGLTSLDWLRAFNSSLAPPGFSNNVAANSIPQVAQPSSTETARDNLSDSDSRNATSDDGSFQLAQFLAPEIVFPPDIFFGRLPPVPRNLVPLDELPKGSANGPRAGMDFPRNLAKPSSPEEYPPCTYCRSGKLSTRPYHSKNSRRRR